MKNKWILPVAALLLFGNAHAEIKLPALIADNMVLEQNTRVALWGWAAAGEKVTVQCSWNRQPVSVTAGKEGRWQVRVQTIAAGGPYSILFKGSNTITVKNVLLGEVWLCSGQSNMEFPLGKQKAWRTGVFHYEEEIAKAGDPELRLFTVKQEVADEPLADVNGQWDACTPQTVAGFSAVAYYFGREIRKTTGFPVGLIHSSWGGTPAESWVRKEVLLSDKDFLPILDRYKTAMKTYPDDLKHYELQLDKWKKDTAGNKKPVKPVDPLKNSKSPSKLYNAMIHPLIPFTIKGAIWYQGESNADRACQYRKLFPALINSWRQEWKDDFPFYFVQIAPHYKQNPEIREAQLLTYKSVPHTGMAVITDIGDSLNIHPRTKDVVGHRLALWALAKDYGKKIPYSGPVYEGMQTQGNKIRVRFHFADGGLILKDGAAAEFMIAGKDQQFVPANARIEGNTVVVWSEAVQQPVAVRYGWKHFPHALLYNEAGLPASPYRTDDWPGETMNKQ
ncbi:sialate O-acetylesterase [Niabella ginsenosidivorans]|uniref:Sialate O-acetylesterase n=1 Tax=Niabella ginsenosidivorans TaxID=1176587 RepID=A0A1A9I3U8_9BACT|nr:sialate O-acetylesterase [Niabella ginsenosidivorans]ANH82213.1 sialate O-acetylesterase [Niabella ginsenosidivorans]